MEKSRDSENLKKLVARLYETVVITITSGGEARAQRSCIVRFGAEIDQIVRCLLRAGGNCTWGPVVQFPVSPMPVHQRVLEPPHRIS